MVRTALFILSINSERDFSLFKSLRLSLYSSLAIVILTIIRLRLRSEANTLKNKYVKQAPEWGLSCAYILIRSQNCFGDYGKWERGTGNGERGTGKREHENKNKT